MGEQLTPREVEERMWQFGASAEAAAAVRAAMENPTEATLKEAMRLAFADPMPGYRSVVESGPAPPLAGRVR